MKKISTILVSLCLILLCGVTLAACGDKSITVKDGGTMVYNANITSWYDYEEERYLDTSIDIDFDQIRIGDIDKITFELYRQDTKLGDAVSEGERLVNLFNEAKIYWTKPEGGNYTAEDSYKTVTGKRTLSCAFKTRTEADRGDIWLRSANTVTEDASADKLTVRVLVGKVEYVATYRSM